MRTKQQVEESMQNIRVLGGAQKGVLPCRAANLLVQAKEGSRMTPLEQEGISIVHEGAASNEWSVLLRLPQNRIWYGTSVLYAVSPSCDSNGEAARDLLPGILPAALCMHVCAVCRTAP